MALPRPMFVYIDEPDVLPEFIAEWINLSSLKPLHTFSPNIEVQIIDINYDNYNNSFQMNVSDGVHYITANVDQKLDFKILRQDVGVFDIVSVIEASGHPASFNFEMVSIYLKRFYIL